MNYITDTDFVNGRLEGDDYSLIYGIIQHCTHNSELKDKYIYNLMATLCKQQWITALKNAKVNHWIKLLDIVIDKLTKYDTDNNRITIPFANIYEYDVTDILSGFSLAKSVLQELHSIHIDSIELIDKIKYAYPIQTLEDLFTNLMIDIDTGCVEGLTNSDIYIVTDEMIRRGIYVRQHITKSEYYDDDTYRKTFIGEDNRITVTANIQKDDYQEEVMKKGLLKEKCGTIYYMLRQQVDSNVLEKVCCYIFNKEFDKSNKNNNTVCRYFRNPRDMFGNVEDVIRDNLNKYDFEIPVEIQPKKTHKL